MSSILHLILSLFLLKNCQVTIANGIQHYGISCLLYKQSTSERLERRNMRIDNWYQEFRYFRFCFLLINSDHCSEARGCNSTIIVRKMSIFVSEAKSADIMTKIIFYITVWCIYNSLRIGMERIRRKIRRSYYIQPTADLVCVPIWDKRSRIATVFG